MPLGDNLRRLRKGKNWTQLELSKKTGIKLAHISKLENGESDPKLSTLEKLIKALECSADDLLFNAQNGNLSSYLRHAIKQAEELPAKDQGMLIEIINRFTVTNNLELVREGLMDPREAEAHEEAIHWERPELERAVQADSEDLHNLQNRL